MLIKYIDTASALNKVDRIFVFDFVQFHFLFSFSISFSTWTKLYIHDKTECTWRFCIAKIKRTIVYIFCCCTKPPMNWSVVHINRLWTLWVQKKQFDWVKTIPNKTIWIKRNTFVAQYERWCWLIGSQRKHAGMLAIRCAVHWITAFFVLIWFADRCVVLVDPFGWSKFCFRSRSQRIDWTTLLYCIRRQCTNSSLLQSLII